MSEPVTRTRRVVFTATGIFFLALVLYFRTLQFPFIVYDDPGYVYENRHVLSGLSWDGVVWAFTTGERSNWHPLTWLSHMADVQAFGVNAGWHHFTNAVLHAANSTLVFLFLHYAARMFWPGVFVALIFAVHPTHVESVAWISERKDVLCAFFFLLALLAYARYTRAPSVTSYLTTTLAFILSLLAKPMAVTWPFVLLLLDVWPLDRKQSLSRRIAEKTPWFILTLIHCSITLYVQSAGQTVRTLDALPLEARIKNAALAYLAYIGKTLVPVNLAPFYPHDDIPWIRASLAIVLLVTITLLTLATLKRWPYLFVGWCWFMGMLVPVIGLVQVGGQSMADRYLYLPQIGVTITAAWALYDVITNKPALRIPISIGISVAIFLLTAMTSRQLHFWRDSVTLFSHTLEASGPSGEAHTILGYAHQLNKDWELAVEQYNAALALQPGQTIARNNLAVTYLALKQWDDAEREARTIIANNPAYTPAYINLGAAAEGRGNLAEAAAHYVSAIRVAPDALEAYEKLGAVSLLLERSEDAIAAYAHAVRLAPDSAATWTNYGIALSSAGQHEDAESAYRTALERDPNFSHAKYYLGLSYWLRQDATGAERVLAELVERHPDYSEGVALLEEVRSAGTRQQR